MSAPGATTTGFLPPNSNVTGTRLSDAARATRAPIDGEPVKNVPRSLKDEGCKLLSLTETADGSYLLTVEK